jgi:hypothetical protein
MLAMATSPIALYYIVKISNDLTLISCFAEIIHRHKGLFTPPWPTTYNPADVSLH